MPYEPRGKVKTLLDAMQADPSRVWTAPEVAKVVECSQGGVLAYLNLALDNRALYKSLLKGRNIFSLQPFGQVVPPPQHAMVVDPTWRPPVMVAPRGTPAPTVAPQRGTWDPQAVLAKLDILHPVDHAIDAVLQARIEPAPTPEPAAPSAPPPEEEAPAPFNASLWADGDLILYGLTELEDGGQLVRAEDVQRLRRLIAWAPA